MMTMERIEELREQHARARLVAMSHDARTQDMFESASVDYVALLDLAAEAIRLRKEVDECVEEMLMHADVDDNAGGVFNAGAAAALRDAAEDLRLCCAALARTEEGTKR